MEEDVKPHSKEKSILLQGYSYVVYNINKGTGQPLGYVDFFAGPGTVKTVMPNGKEEVWPGSPRAFLDNFIPSSSKVTAILNDLDPANYKQLCTIATDYSHKGMDVYPHNMDANMLMDVVEKTMKREWWNVFFLDPWNCKSLPWSLIERCANFARPGKYLETSFIRRPELLINFMTMDMQRNYDNDPQCISSTLGMTEKEWRPLIEDSISQDIPLHRTLKDIYCQKLKTIYGTNPHAIPILQPEKRNTLYYLILVSSHPASPDIYSRLMKWGEDKKVDFIAEYSRAKINVPKGIDDSWG